MSTPSSLISDKELIVLKEQILKAVFNDQPLPGSNRNISFPDLPFLVAQPSIYLVDSIVKENIAIEKIHRPIQVVTMDFLKQESGTSEKIVYLQFEITEATVDELSINLVAKVYAAATNRAADLSAMQLKFKKTDGKWQMINGPTSLSA